MPALPPPSMQIGALPNGASTVSPLPAGPSLQYGFNEQQPVLVQQVAGASSSAAPAAFTLSGITATKAGSFLVFLVAAALSGAPTISTPTGWTPVAGASGLSGGNTLAGRLFVLPSAAAGITSVVISTLAGVNGIATWFGEFQNVFAVDPVYNSAGGNGAQNFTASGSTPSGVTYTAPVQGPLLLVGFETDLTGQAYTPANVGANWVTGTPATSTIGATNTIIRPFFTVTNPLILQGNYLLAGTLAGALANGASLVSLLTATTGGLLSYPGPFGFPGGGGGQAWGALGGTKPGGAGGGQ